MKDIGDAEPLTNAEATDLIRSLAQDPELTLNYKIHAKEQMAARGIIVSDVLFALRNGFVRRAPLPSTRAGFFKYGMESKTPNTDSRQIRIITIPDGRRKEMKLVTIMWVDEQETRSGSEQGELE